MCKARQSSWYSTFCVWHWQKYRAWPSFRWEEMFIPHPTVCKTAFETVQSIWNECKAYWKKSLCINARAWQLRKVLFCHFWLFCLWFRIFFSLCLFCWADYPIEEDGLSVELGIARRINLLIWHIGWIFPLSDCRRKSHLMRCAVCFSLFKWEVTKGPKGLSCF